MVRLCGDRQRDHPRLLLENQQTPPAALRIAFVKRNYVQRGAAPLPSQYAKGSNLPTALTVDPVCDPLRDDPVSGNVVARGHRAIVLWPETICTQTSHDRCDCAFRLLFRQQRLGKTDRDAEIRATETFQDCYSDSDNFSIAVEERTAGATRGCLRVEHNFVGQDVADVALRDQWMNQIAFGEFVKYLRNVAAAFFQDILRGFFIGARQDCGKAGGVTHQDDRLSAQG